jgi:hypothetical protein
LKAGISWKCIAKKCAKAGKSWKWFCGLAGGVLPKNAHSMQIWPFLIFAGKRPKKLRKTQKNTDFYTVFGGFKAIRRAINQVEWLSKSGTISRAFSKFL